MSKHSPLYYKKNILVVLNGGDHTLLVDQKFFDDIATRQEALCVALNTYDMLNEIIIQECVENEEKFVNNNMKFSKCLQRCLDELDRRYPFLIHEMTSMSIKFKSGRKLVNC